MKNRLIQHIFRKIKNNYKRFISLLCMSLLGVGFYAGIKATSPDMLKTLDNFFDNQEVYDIEIVSTLGLTTNDIEELKKISSLDKVIGTSYKDVITEIESEEYVIRLLPIINDINKLYLVEGSYPTNDNEILIDEAYLKDNNYKIGDTITINSDLNIKEFKIVGVALSPLYFSTISNRGTTTLGNGSIKYFAYVNEDIITNDYYTNIYITVKDAKDKITFEDEYKKLIDDSIKEIEEIKTSREDARYNEIYGQIIENANNHGLEIDTSKFAKSTWYIWDRSENGGYKDLTDATLNIKKLGNVFPLVFYIIAILISLISMKRMIEEDRTENGTLKALGFNNLQITMKYIVYSVFATVIGGFLGMLIGFNLIPNTIWNIYELIFTIPNFTCEFDFLAGLNGLLIALFCITGTAIYVSYKNLKEVPANLMRPKSPKIGKKIFLEKISILWNHLNFSRKITIRNIFRYKGRVLATIIGISGCTALILSGFGLRDSISDIANLQFSNVFHYDKLLTLKENEDYTNLLNYLNNDSNINNVSKIYMDNISIYFENNKEDAILIVPDKDTNLNNVISLNDINNNYNEISLDDNGILISNKTATNLGLEVGDIINLVDSNNKSVDVKVEYIIENYVNHYIVMSNNLYNKLYDNYKVNTLMLNMNDLNVNDNFNKYLINNYNITSIIDTKDTIKTITDMMDKLTSVVVILILAAAILAFVVLYNLSNINISERKREIATLKVLGFYNKEVDNYITRENIILTFIGIIIGLISGLYLTHFIISTCEPDYIMFVRHINLISYMLAIIITTIFTIIVNIITHFNLKNINMIESLKNVE